MHDIAVISERSGGLLKSRTPMQHVYTPRSHGCGFLAADVYR